MRTFPNDAIKVPQNAHLLQRHSTVVFGEPLVTLNSV